MPISFLSVYQFLRSSAKESGQIVLFSNPIPAFSLSGFGFKTCISSSTYLTLVSIIDTTHRVTTTLYIYIQSCPCQISLTINKWNSGKTLMDSLHVIFSFRSLVAYIRKNLPFVVVQWRCRLFVVTSLRSLKESAVKISV